MCPICSLNVAKCWVNTNFHSVPPSSPNGCSQWFSISPDVPSGPPHFPTMPPCPSITMSRRKGRGAQRLLPRGRKNTPKQHQTGGASPPSVPCPVLSVLVERTEIGAGAGGSGSCDPACPLGHMASSIEYRRATAWESQGADQQTPRSNSPGRYHHIPCRCPDDDRSEGRRRRRKCTSPRRSRIRICQNVHALEENTPFVWKCMQRKSNDSHVLYFLR